LSTVVSYLRCAPSFLPPSLLTNPGAIEKNYVGAVDDAAKLEAVPVLTSRHRTEALPLLSRVGSDAEFRLDLHFWDMWRRMWPCTTLRGGAIMTDVQQDGDPRDICRCVIGLSARF